MEKKLSQMDSMIKTSEADELAETVDTQELMAHADALLQCARPLANPHAAGLKTPQPMKSPIAEALDQTEPMEAMVIPNVNKDEKNGEMTKTVDDADSQKAARRVRKLRGSILKPTATSKKRKVETEVEECSPEIDNEKPKKRQIQIKEAKAESSSAGSGKPPSESRPEKKGITKKDAEVSKLPKADPKSKANVGHAARANKAGNKALKGNEEDMDAKKKTAPKAAPKRM